MIIEAPFAARARCGGVGWRVIAATDETLVAKALSKLPGAAASPGSR